MQRLSNTNPTTNQDEHMCSGRVGISCSTDVLFKNYLKITIECKLCISTAFISSKVLNVENRTD